MEELVNDGMISTGYGVSSNLRGCNWSVSGVENDYEAVCLESVVDWA